MRHQETTARIKFLGIGSFLLCGDFEQNAVFVTQELGERSNELPAGPFAPVSLVYKHFLDLEYFALVMKQELAVTTEEAVDLVILIESNEIDIIFIADILEVIFFK